MVIRVFSVFLVFCFSVTSSFAATAMQYRQSVRSVKTDIKKLHGKRGEAIARMSVSEMFRSLQLDHRFARLSKSQRSRLIAVLKYIDSKSFENVRRAAQRGELKRSASMAELARISTGARAQAELFVAIPVWVAYVAGAAVSLIAAYLYLNAGRVEEDPELDRKKKANKKLPQPHYPAFQ